MIIDAPGIRTTYRGVQFRSRLEARWAAFFDRLQWPWAYEPFDLAGYIPDFVLGFQRPLLVEVKPIWPEFTADWDAVVQKIEASGWTEEALIVPVQPYLADRWAYLQTIGWLRDTRWDPTGAWGLGNLFRCAACHHWSLFHDEQSYECRRTGCYDGDHHLHSDDYDRDHAQLVDHWHAAGNVTQWKG